MRTDPETTRAVRSWMEDGVTALPDRILDSVLDQVPATPQRRATWWPSRRFPVMNNPVRIALAAAAVVVLAFLGFRFLVLDNTGGPGQTPTPIPTATTGPAALPDSAELDAGTTYFMAEPWGEGLPRLIFTVPASGWTTVGTVNVGKDAIADPRNFHDIAMTPWTVENLNLDPCLWQSGDRFDPPVGPTVDDLAAALVEQAGGTASVPTDVTLGGYAGKKVELSLPAGLDIATCQEQDFGRWIERLGAVVNKGGHIYGNGQRNVVYILDVDGLRALIDTSYMPGTSDATLAELEEILASIRIEP